MQLPVFGRRRRQAGEAEATPEPTVTQPEPAATTAAPDAPAADASAPAGEAPARTPRPRRRRAPATKPGSTASEAATAADAEAAPSPPIDGAETPEEAPPAHRRRRRPVSTRGEKAPTETLPPILSPQDFAPAVATNGDAPAEAPGVRPRRRRRSRAKGPGEGEALDTPATSDDNLAAQIRDVRGRLDDISSRLGEGMRRTSLAKVAVFVDVPNVMYAAERSRVNIDYAKLLRYLVGDRELVRAAAYAPISDDPNQVLEMQRFVQPFAGHYRIVTKPLKRFADGTIKANFDVELAIDILTMAERLDVITLISGDGDFRRLLELVAGKGVRVEVVGFGHSVAAELRAAADRFIDLQDMAHEVAKTPPSRARRSSP